jgi:hypothetical protein
MIETNKNQGAQQGVPPSDSGLDQQDLCHSHKMPKEGDFSVLFLNGTHHSEQPKKGMLGRQSQMDNCPKSAREEAEVNIY